MIKLANENEFKKMIIIVWIISFVAGYLGWSYWLSIPLGFVLFWSMVRYDSRKTAGIAKFAFITGPLICLGIMFIGHLVGG